MNRRALLVWLGALGMARGRWPAALAQTADASFHAVSYVESSKAAAREASRALSAYRDAALKLDGSLRVQAFEQTGRPGHWVIIETWRDRQAFDARDASVSQRLTDALRTIRVSGLDQRPYKAVSVAPATSGVTAGVWVISHVDVAPNPAVAPTLTRLAETSRQEAGNVRFDVLQHTMRANHFTVVEGWRDAAALEAHVTAAHTKQYRDDILPLTGSPLDERVFSEVR